MERVGLEAAADSLGTETDARRTAIPQLSNRRLNVSASVQSRAPVNVLWLRNGQQLRDGDIVTVASATLQAHVAGH